MTQEEFSDKYLSKIQLSRPTNSVVDLQSPPESFDWQAQGGVTPVQNNGSSSSSDVIVIVKTVETLHFIHTGKLVQLSTQQLIDCAPPFSTIADYYKYITNAGGLMSARDYPSSNSKTCKFDRTKITAEVNDYLAVTPQNQSILKFYSYAGTLIVGVDASSVGKLPRL